MDKPPIGYRSRKKRKWPRVVIPLIIILGIVFTVYKIDPDFNKIKYIISLYNKEILVEKSESGNKDDTLQVTDSTDLNTDSIIQNTEVDIIENTISKENKGKLIDTGKDKFVDTSKNKKTQEITHTTKTDTNRVSKIDTGFSQNTLAVINSQETKSNENLKTDSVNITTVKYYVIISSVNSKEAADKQQQKFEQMSVKTDVIYAEKNNRYRISLGTYSNYKDASAKANSFQAKYPAYKTWVWKM